MAVILQAIYFISILALLALKKRDWLFVVLMSGYLFLPRAMAVGTAVGNWTFQRSIMLVCVIYLVVSFSVRFSRNDKLLTNYFAAFLVCSVLFLFGLFTVYYQADSFQHLMIFSFELVGAILAVPYFVDCLSKSSNKDFTHLFVRVLKAGLYINLLVACVELIYKTPLVTMLFPVQANIDEEILSGWSRVDSGSYRVVGVFVNPLELAFYLTLGSIVVWWEFVIGKGSRVVSFCILLAAVFIIMKTGSRAGVIFLLAAMFLVVLLIKRSLVKSTVYFSLFAFIGLIAGFIYSAEINSFLMGSGFAERSTQSRIAQFAIAPALMMVHPFYGYGLISNVTDLTILSQVDVWFIRLGLQVGLVGAFVVLLYILMNVVRLLRKMAGSIQSEGALVLVVYCILCFGWMFFISIPYLIYSFFVVLVLLNKKA